MTDHDTAEMIQRCIDEISVLRAERDRLAPRAEAYGLIGKIIGLIPERQQGYGEDIIWQLKKELADLQPKVEPAAA